MCTCTVRNSPMRLHQKGELARPQGSLATDDHSRPICLEFRSLSSPFLKLFKVADVTVLSSRAFRMLTIRSVKKYLIKSVLNLFLRNFLKCPRVLPLPLVSYSKKLSKWIPEYHSSFCKLQSSPHEPFFLPRSIDVTVSIAVHKACSSIQEPYCKAITYMFALCSLLLFRRVC